MPSGLLHRRPDSGLGNIRSSPSAPGRNIDWVLMIAHNLLGIIGLFVIYSASWSKTPNPFQYVTRQEIFLIVAVITMVIVMAVDYETWKERATFLYGVTIVLLVLVLTVGAIRNGSRLSFNVGPLLIQPAEFAKFTVLLALAAYVSGEQAERISYTRFSGALVLIGVPTLLIIVQPDLGSALVIVAMVMGVLLIAGARAKHILAITGLAAATVGAAVLTRIVNPYQLERITTFVNASQCNEPKMRDLCFQVQNATKAIATGGITGKGWLKGPITLSKDVPIQWADFPMSAVGEQFGLIGCGVLLGLFGVVLFRIWRIAHLSRDQFGTLICAGVFTMILFQVFQNVGMTIGLMPVTGLPLPFISYGGSGLVSFYALIGLVQSVHMRRYR